jgi:hypothetical protein
VSRVHIVLEEVAELKRSMAENAELKELREQFARLTSSVKGKTLKITSDILGLPVKPVCGNCSKNAGGPNDHACYMEITWSTEYTSPLTRRMLSDENGILRDTDRVRPRELTQTPISIVLSPGDKVIVQSATFICKKQFIHNVVCPFNKTPSWYENDVKNFVQEAFDRLCHEVTQPLEPHLGVNMDEYMAKYTDWVKAGIAHAAREGVNGALSMSHHINEFTVPPPKLDSITSNKKVINSYNLDIKSITPEKLGLSLDFCNNCGDRGCSLGIHYIVEDSPGEYRINYQFTWDTESNRKVSYDRKDGDWKSIENPNLTLLEPAKVLVQSAIFECSKPFNARGSRPTGNCGHSGVAGNCSCGRHQNNVKELIQAAFDRITRIS